MNNSSNTFKDNKIKGLNNGFSIATTKEASKSLLELTPVSDRIITARFWSKTTMIQVNAPTDDPNEDDKYVFL